MVELTPRGIMRRGLAPEPKPVVQGGIIRSLLQPDHPFQRLALVTCLALVLAHNGFSLFLLSEDERSRHFFAPAD